jgi:hypothetical protein
LAIPKDIPAVTRQLKVDVSPGHGGYGGKGGPPGIGGREGERGRGAPPFCQDDANPGIQGKNGDTGTDLSEVRAADGAAGVIAIGELSEGQAKAIGIWR